MHIVIGGEDEVAFRLAEELMEEHAVVLICPEGKTGPQTDRLDVEVVEGPITSAEVLARARAGDADFFIACSETDEENLVASVLVKKLGSKRTICFLSRPGFERRLGEDSSLAEIFDIDQVIRPAEQLGQEILRIMMVPGALDVEAFEGGRVRLLRHAIEEGARITSAPLRDLAIPLGVVLVMARRGDEIFLPRGDTQLESGDKVTVMGTLAGINRLLFGFLRGTETARPTRQATIVGGGTVGTTVALGLEEAGWSVKIIETDRERCEEISALLDKTLVLHGDGADIDLLEQEQIGEDSVLVVVTSNDEKNLLVSLLAKSMGVPRILTRATTQANERLFERVGIDVVRSARGAAIQTVLRAVVQGKSTMLAELEHGEAMVLELRVPKGIEPIPIQSMRGPRSAIIGAILRGRRVIVPHGGDDVQAEDRLLVFCLERDQEQVAEYFQTHIAKER
jgi:trk system potassium uptake protein TrkA